MLPRLYRVDEGKHIYCWYMIDGLRSVMLCKGKSPTVAKLFKSGPLGQ